MTEQTKLVTFLGDAANAMLQMEPTDERQACPDRLLVTPAGHWLPATGAGYKEAIRRATCREGSQVWEIRMGEEPRLHFTAASNS